MSFSFASMSKISAALVVAAAVALPVTSATAGENVPDVTFTFQVGEQDPIVFNPDGTSVGGGVFNFQGQQATSDWLLQWDLNADPDPFISGNIVVTNFSMVTQTFSFTVTLPVGVVYPSTIIGGSVAGGITADGNGGTLSGVGGGDIWTALIDGAPVATLLGGSVSVGAFESGSLGPAAFGQPIPNQPGPALNGSIAINLTFELTPGDSASFTSVFVVVPGPAGLALLGVAGCIAGRRRRRA